MKTDIRNMRGMGRILIMASTALIGISLASCTTSEVLEPASLHGTDQKATSTTPSPAVSTPGATASTPATGQPVAAIINSSAKFRFVPVVGSTVQAVTPLSERMASRAKERGIGLVRSDDTTATHVLKGYLSAISEGNETTVIYVWDVLDASGNRLHRIQGQQKAGKGEGWTAVQPQTMQAIADVTIDQLAAWLASPSG